MYLPDFLSRSPIWRGTEEQRLRAVMDKGEARARRARVLLPLSDDGRFKSLLAAAKGDQAYQALVKAVATRTTSAELGAYTKELDGMVLIGEEEEGEQLVALNDRIVVPENWVSDAIKAAHAPHLGADLTIQNAKRMFGGRRCPTTSATLLRDVNSVRATK